MLFTTALLMGTVAHGSDHEESPDQRTSQEETRSVNSHASSIRSQDPAEPRRLRKISTIHRNSPIATAPFLHRKIAQVESLYPDNDQQPTSNDINHLTKALKLQAEALKLLSQTTNKQWEAGQETINELITTIRNEQTATNAALNQAHAKLTQTEQALQAEKSGWRRRLKNITYLLAGAHLALTGLTVYGFATNKIKFTNPKFNVTPPEHTPVVSATAMPAISITPEITFTPAPKN